MAPTASPRAQLSDLTAFFERVVCINLPARADRWAHFRANLPSDWPFKPPMRFPALDGTLLSKPAWWHSSPGAWGCLQSHLRVLNDCIAQRVESILVLEDDAVFIKGFSSDVRQFLSELPDDWQFVFLGGQHIRLEVGLPRRVSDWVYRPFNVNRGHAYALRGRTIMERVRDHLQTEVPWPLPHHRDHYVGRLQEQLANGLYAPQHWLVGQAPGASDISKRSTQLRLFPGSRWLVECEPKLPFVLVQCTDRKLADEAGRVLSSLRVWGVGSNVQTFNEQFGRVITRCIDLETLCKPAEAGNRAGLTRIWATKLADSAPPGMPFVSACHPLLALFQDEIDQWCRSCYWVLVESTAMSLLNSLKKLFPHLGDDAIDRLAAAVDGELAQLVRAPKHRVLKLSETDLLTNGQNLLREFLSFPN